jgi:hypothetical protein
MVKKISIIKIYFQDCVLLIIEGEGDELDIEDRGNNNNGHATLSWQHHFSLVYAN